LTSEEADSALALAQLTESVDARSGTASGRERRMR